MSGSFATVLTLRCTPQFERKSGRVKNTYGLKDTGGQQLRKKGSKQSQLARNKQFFVLGRLAWFRGLKGSSGSKPDGRVSAKSFVSVGSHFLSISVEDGLKWDYLLILCRNLFFVVLKCWEGGQSFHFKLVAFIFRTMAEDWAVYMTWYWFCLQNMHC